MKSNRAMCNYQFPACKDEYIFVLIVYPKPRIYFYVALTWSIILTFTIFASFFFGIVNMYWKKFSRLNVPTCILSFRSNSLNARLNPNTIIITLFSSRFFSPNTFFCSLKKWLFNEFKGLKRREYSRNQVAPVQRKSNMLATWGCEAAAASCCGF